MKKKYLFFLVLFLIIGISIMIYFYFNNTNNNENNYTADKASTSSENNNSQNNEISENQSENSNTDLTSKPPEYKEEQLSTFSTKIYSKDSARQNNIQITCNTLNGTTVKNGETFSFCNTVGKATSSKGYEKADIFDKDGNKKKGLRWWELSSK